MRRGLDTRAQVVDWVEIDRRDAAVLAAALEGARDVARQAALGVGYATRDALVDASERTADALEELAAKFALAQAETDRLRVEVAELRVAVAEARLVIDRAKSVLDLPSPSVRRDLN